MVSLGLRCLACLLPFLPDFAAAGTCWTGFYDYTNQVSGTQLKITAYGTTTQEQMYSSQCILLGGRGFLHFRNNPVRLVHTEIPEITKAHLVAIPQPSLKLNRNLGTCWDDFDRRKLVVKGKIKPITVNGVEYHTMTWQQCALKCGKGWREVKVNNQGVISIQDYKVPAAGPIERRHLQEVSPIIELEGEPEPFWEGPLITDPDPDQFPPFCEAFGGGEPHFKTWKGEWFDWHGECDVVFMVAPTLDMTIHIRTKKRYGYSYIESAALQVRNQTLQVSGWGDFIYEGVNNAEFDDIGGYPVTYTGEPYGKDHEFDVDIGEGEHIRFKTFKDWVSIVVDGHSKDRFGDSVGLLGSFHTGEHLARDGATVIYDVQAFAEEWQVRDTEPSLFQASRKPIYPDKCTYPSAADIAKVSRRRLGESVARETAAGACAHLENEFIEKCMDDVMASGDIEMAQAYSN